ncbi:hypothetical protein [Comamonas thiooxydans]|uniref:hypothetical protein n=1 Tax=Comamonas thiooxydans TaxID=363952 RepID=UPI000ABD8747|nr:hypothetical protein [Comamonas thiooxydans]
MSTKLQTALASLALAFSFGAGLVVNGVSIMLPGLKIRGDANVELCEWGLSWRG